MSIFMNDKLTNYSIYKILALDIIIARIKKSFLLKKFRIEIKVNRLPDQTYYECIINRKLRVK